ncbi:hypothetical protein AYO21_01914 [Fonsecaea monophora]|uniref:Uncharacterized protein n=1 Tax=Fonsecaea monophora TaxID=254056 RepID=A0A177FHQ2_9EURO|nr:hypothetical protein AYO21_01914 [Fonsecaea monophora]KAH0844765.1 hypothetical protein FOPE_09794 [Fonsecaea pedrosoi]OAG43687.1 hypothetical protein AYO21_01914 [Fonsecaea monophora]
MSPSTAAAAAAAATAPPLPFSLANELKALRHEKRNQNLSRLPANATIQRRPLNHAPVADLRSSGTKTPKVVYVSARTPVVAAIKRVKKYLVHIERRALEDAGGGFASRKHGHGKGGGHPARAAEKANETLARDKEEVLVKASGRAMGQALRVGEWFRNKEKDMLCRVEVRTGNVSTVDDIVQLDDLEEEKEEEDEHAEHDDPGQNEKNEDVEEGTLEEPAEPSTLQCGDTTLELLGGVDVATKSSGENKSQSTLAEAQMGMSAAEQSANDTAMHDSLPNHNRRRRKKRKRPTYEAENLPEARIRWIKTVEVAISLQT